MAVARARRVAGALTVLLGLGALASIASLEAGCQNQSLALIGDAHVEATVIDGDPLALLPSGILGLGYLDAAAMFQTKWGPEVGQLIAHLLPLGPESSFVAPRDVLRVYGGVYALQGADFCAVVQGSFDVDAIRRSADARSITIAGAPLVKSRYAGNDMFTAGNLGFVLLTPHTALTGNETGMRRALDRLRSGKLSRSVPDWMVEFTRNPKASLAFAGEPGSGPTVQAASQVVTFLGGLRRVRALGNFGPPGVNVQGSLTYADPHAAESGATGLQNAQRLATLASMFGSLGGMPIPSVQTSTKDNEVAFTLPVDESLLRHLLRLATTAAGTSVAVNPPTH